MTNKQILKILGLGAALGTLVSLHLVYWNIESGIQKNICFITLAFLVGFLIYFPAVGYRAKTMSGSLAKTSIAAIIGFLALILGALSTNALVNGHLVTSAVLDISAFVFILFTVGASLISSQHVDDLTAAKDYSSDHILWASNLDYISTKCNEKDLKDKIKKITDNLPYIARDPSNNKLAINSQITAVITTLSENVLTARRSDIEVNLNQILDLLTQRESQLKQSRNQV
jgi:hypothetical protein